MIKTSATEKVPIYYILECAVNPDDISCNIIRENTIITSDGSKVKTATVDCVLQSFETLNWNGRTYPSNVVMESLDSNQKIQNDIKMKQWAGEYGHPDSSEMKRLAVILPSMTSHYIDSYYKKGNLLRGMVTNAPCGYGNDMYNLLMAGRPWAFSLRAFGSVDRKGVALRPLTTITYDEVNRPSHKEAYGTSSDIVDNTSPQIDTKMLQECSSMVEISGSSIEHQITNFVLEASDNVKFARDLFGLTETTAYHNGKGYIILEGSYMNNRIHVSVPLESYVRSNYHDLLKY